MITIAKKSRGCGLLLLFAVFQGAWSFHLMNTRPLIPRKRHTLQKIADRYGQPTKRYSLGDPEEDKAEECIRYDATQDETKSTKNALLRSQVNRRTALSATATSLVGLAAFSKPSMATSSLMETDPMTSVSSNLDVLSNLPPIPKGQVRLYLCRHGQTENNRLQLVQGARVNAPLNNMGMKQAERLGKALSRASPAPCSFFSSSLLRAQQTADVASQQFPSTIPRVTPLPSLGEVDFGGTLEEVPVARVRPQMLATYASWASGNVEARMEDDGENLVQILGRQQVALETLIDAANNCDSKCVAAVTHSSYLRILLSAAQDFPLAQFITVELPNCCINVLDFPASTTKMRTTASRTLGAKSHMFVRSSLYPQSEKFHLDMPTGVSLRTGEKRHLEEILI